MKWITGCCLLLLSFHLMADESRESLLLAWEVVQKNSSEVAEFERLEDKRYRIRFAHMPYAGELKVLAFNSEKMKSPLGNSPYSHSGYVEVDLVGTTSDEISKFSRSYGQWLRTNTLFYNQETQTWDSWSTYREFLEQAEEELGSRSGGLLLILDYLPVVFFIIVLYFVVATIRNNKSMKQSLTVQKRAVEDYKVVERLSRESIELQKENNALLAEVLAELKKQAGGKDHD